MGFNQAGFNRGRIHRDTQNEYDPLGFNFFGFNRVEMHKETSTEWDPTGRNIDRYDINGRDLDGNLAGVEVLPRAITPIRYYLAATSREYRSHLHDDEPTFLAGRRGSENQKRIRAQFLCNQAGFTRVMFIGILKVSVPLNPSEVLEPVSSGLIAPGPERALDVARYSAFSRIESTDALIPGRDYNVERGRNRDALYEQVSTQLPNQVFTSVLCQ